MENAQITNKDDCQELKNIKYKTMLLKGTNLKETKTSNNLENLEKFLEKEKNNSENEPWCKLNKTIKMRKLNDYVSKYSKDKNLNADETKVMSVFLKDCIDRKKLHRVKDVIYNKDTGEIIDIPGLQYVKSNKNFTLKNIDKRVSTLKSLTPKKGKSIKNNTGTTGENDDDDDYDEEDQTNKEHTK